MSGGHWDYIQFRIEEIADELNPENLEEKKEGLEEQITKIDRIINELKGIDGQQEKCGDTPTRQHSRRESSEERKVSKKNKSDTAGRPTHKERKKKEEDIIKDEKIRELANEHEGYTNE